MKKYSKAFVAASGVLLVLANVLSDGAISADDGLQVLVALGVALGVYRVPNKIT